MRGTNIPEKDKKKVPNNMELLKGGGFFLKRGGGQKSCNKNLVKMLTVSIALQHITINCDIYIIWSSQPVNFLLCQKEGEWE